LKACPTNDRQEMTSNTSASAEMITAPDAPRPGASPPDLVDLPVLKIKRSSGWRAVNFRELWHFRELLWFLALRDIKVRYKQTALGVAWAVLQPLLTMLVFTLFF